jgi:phosphoribosylglycinamide formyltransferase 1
MKRLAIFLSGGGTTAEAIIKATMTGGKLYGIVEVGLVISSRADAGGIQKVLKTGAIGESDVIVLRPLDFADVPQKTVFGCALINECRRRNIDMFSQNGWMVKTPRNFIDEFPGINQHPAPLCPGEPDFGGEGMYGKRCHMARLLFTRMTNRNMCTAAVAQMVHPDYDKGKIICQSFMPILPSDTVDSMATRLLPFEHEMQIEAIRRLATGESGEQVIHGFEYHNESIVLPYEMLLWHFSRDAARIAYPKG